MENTLQTPEATFNRGDEPEKRTLLPSDLSDIKTMGGLAALFAAGSIIPYIGFLLSLASIVLFLITFHKISVFSGKRSIFVNIGVSYLIGFVLGIAIAAFIIIAFLDYFKELSYNNFDEDYLYYMIQSAKESVLTTIIAIVVFFLMVTVTCAYLWKLSLDKTAQFFGDNAFKTAGILYIIGASTMILCGLGALVNLAAHIVLAVAFFSLKMPKNPA